MKDRGIYPLTVSFYEEHPELASRTMISRRPHGDGFVGLAELMTADITGECFDDIRVGERLEVTAGSSGRSRRISVLTVGSEALGVESSARFLFPNLSCPANCCSAGEIFIALRRQNPSALRMCAYSFRFMPNIEQNKCQPISRYRLTFAFPCAIISRSEKKRSIVA